MIRMLISQINKLLEGPAVTPRMQSYDELFKDEADGTARYDDIWGAPCATITRTAEPATSEPS